MLCLCYSICFCLHILFQFVITRFSPAVHLHTYSIFDFPFPVNSVTVSPPYRPQSKVARLPFVLKGWSKQYPFTSWSWNLLGVSFALSTYVGYTLHQTGTIDPWLARLTLIVWEVSAPVTLLVGAVVKYALWPAQIKETGHGATFLLPRALLQHNANVIMAVTDVALMGGIPTRIADIPISVIYGCSYVLFSWAIQNVWHGQG